MRTDSIFPIRECYSPAHFGNSYETMWPLERGEYLKEMKWWGFNRFADWMTTTDVCNPTEKATANSFPPKHDNGRWTV